MCKIGRYLLVLWVSIASQLLAATVYYVDSINGNDGNAGTSSAAAWRTIAKINTRSFSPGDKILFARGGVWRERLVVPSSGGSTNPITFGAYGSGADPIITGADLVTDWTSYSTNIWRASLATQANVVLFNGVKGNKKSGINDIASSYDWYWGSSALYVYSTNNPSLIYHSPGIEAGQRVSCIEAHKAYIAFENLHLYGSNGIWGAGGIYAYRGYGANAISVKSCTSEKNAGFGIVLLDCGNNTITDCIVRYNNYGLVFIKDNATDAVSNNLVTGGTYNNNDGTGINLAGTSESNKIYNFGTITNVTAYDNGDNIYFNRVDGGTISHCTLYDTFSPPGGEGYGIGIMNGDNIIVEYCDIYNNESRGIGICADTELFPCTNDIIRYNRIHGNGLNPAHDMVGIQINLYNGIVCTGMQIYYNLIYDHDRGLGSPYYGTGIYIEGADISVYNNVLYNNERAVGVLVDQADDCSIKNNIFLDSIAYHIGVWSGVTGLDINSNTYYPDTGSKFVRSMGSWYNVSAYNFVNWKINTAQDSNSKVADPKFTDVSKNDFHLRSDSPCIDAGTYLNLTKDFYGNTVPFGSGVDTGANEYQAGSNPLSPSLSASPSSGQAPLTVNFTGSASGGTSPYSYSWSFGDGGSSTTQNPSHTYSTAGNYTATLTVTDNASATASSTVNINVTANVPLSANIVASPTSGLAPLAVNFTGSATGGAPPYSYGWNFGDGGSSTTQNPGHTYSTAGNYTATLTVTDSKSATNSKSLSISVTAAPSPLSATASANPTSGQAPLAVNFTGSAGGGKSPYTYSWNFGDSQSSSAQNPSHTYSAAGNLTATLTVTDSASATANASVNISVSASPSLSANANASPTSGLAPLAVNFTGSATGGAPPYSYSWNFGDGSSSTTQNPSHMYSAIGNYTAILTITDSSFANANATVSIAAGSVTAANLALAAETGAPAPGQGGTTDPSPGNHSFSVGSTVQVKSIPNTDYRFSKWAGDIIESSTFSSTTELTMDKSKSLSATFCTQCADVNGDLQITPADAQFAFDIYLGKIANPTWCELENADVKCDGTKLSPKVTPADAQTIFYKYLNRQVASGDCSGNSRTAALPIQNTGFTNVSLTIDNTALTAGQDILIPVIIESPSDIKAFGFDLVFPSNVLMYIGLERTELTNDYDQLDANMINNQMLRVGGYKTNSDQNPSSGVLVTLIFRVTGELRDPSSISVIATYDDIQNASIRNGMINRQNNSQIREDERSVRYVERRSAGKRYDF
jgi:parallel beta-helix repeat protein